MADRRSWTVLGRWNYSLVDNKTLEAVAGVEYNAGCWTLRLVGQRLTTTSQTTTNSVYVQIELNGLARFGTNPLDLLRRSIPGYQKTNDPTVRSATVPRVHRVLEARMSVFSLRARRPRRSARRCPGADPAAAATPPRRCARRAAPVHRTPALDRTITLDRVVAIVNDEALTQNEIDEQKKIALAQMKAQNVTPPSADTLEKQVLERLITERALLQFAKETGVRVDDTQVERTIARIAAGQQDDGRGVPARSDGGHRLREVPRGHPQRDHHPAAARARRRQRITVSESEVDNFLATQNVQAGGDVEYRLSHILVLVPEQASPEQIDAKRARAEEALKQIKGGAEFAQVAAGFSDAQDALQGGALGWRDAGADADGVRRGGAHDEAGRRVGGAALGERLSHRQGAGSAQPRHADDRRADACAAHPDQGQRDRVGFRREDAHRAHPRPHRDAAPSSRTRPSSTRMTAARSRAATSAGCRRATRSQPFEEAMNKLKIERGLAARAHDRSAGT